jgi:predicted nucleic acid-binding protein
MTTYLVDTSAWLWALRSDPVPAIRQRLDDLLASREAASTGMVQLEVLSGIKTVAEWDELAAELGSLRQLHTGPGTWLQAARLGYSLRRRGVTLSNADILIAAVAIENDATLVHADVHFERIAQHSQLKAESYVEYLGTTH